MLCIGKSGIFIFPTDFVILDCEVNFKSPIILGRPFLAMDKALIDMDLRQIKFRLNVNQVILDVCQSI